VLIWLGDFPPVIRGGRTGAQPEGWPVLQRRYQTMGFRVDDPWERALPAGETFAAYDPTAGRLVTIEGSAAERAAFARQLLAVGRFTLRRMEQTAGEHDIRCVDDWEAVAAEVGAELGISRGRASSQMHYGTTLLERFPALGAVFLAGAVDFRVIAAAIFRTDLLTDTVVLYDGGPKPTIAEIPEDMAAREHQVHDNLVEGIVVADDDLMMRYLEGEAISPKEL
jgi:hypothetical protein